VKKFLVTVGLALLLLTVESVVVQQLGLVISRIDVTVVLLAFLALRAHTLEGAFSAYAVGYLLDLMSGQPTGLYTFLGVFTFLVGKLVASLVDVRTRPGFALFAMGADVGHGLLAAFFTWMAAKDEGSTAALLQGLPLQVVLTGVAAVALYPLLRRIEAAQERSSTGLLQ
jgi:rod shape-determining protein MreD